LTANEITLDILYFSTKQLHATFYS